MFSLANRRWNRPFDWLDMLLILGGLLAVGYGINDYSPLHASTVGAVTLTSHGTRLVTTTRTVERKVHGKIVHVDDKVYVTVPLVVVHVDHRTIKVPAHRLRLRSAAAVTANPLVTVYVTVPTTVTQFVPTTVTSTIVSTLTVPTTITITLPLDTGGPNPDE